MSTILSPIAMINTTISQCKFPHSTSFTFDEIPRIIRPTGKTVDPRSMLFILVPFTGVRIGIGVGHDTPSVFLGVICVAGVGLAVSVFVRRAAFGFGALVVIVMC
jgi:hypothetical protein